MRKTIARFLGKYLNTLAWIAPFAAGRQGFHILCSPYRTPFKPHHVDFLDTSEKFIFYQKNIPIQGYRWGNGPRKVLFLHGWESHAFRWKNYIQGLFDEDFTLIAIDAPAHGASGGKYLSVPVYSEIIQHLILSEGGVEVVVGHSLGSFSILHALHVSPSLPVRKVVIMAPPGEANDFLMFFKNLLKLSEKAVNLTKDHFEKVLKQPIDYFSTSRFAGSLNLPGLIVHDEHDNETPYRNAQTIHQVWKKSKLLTTSGLKHNLKSPEVVQMVCDFIISYQEDRPFPGYKKHLAEK